MNTLLDILKNASSSQFGVSFYDMKVNETFVSYSEVDKKSDNVASHLISKGVKKGDVVALCLTTSPFFLDAFFGVIKAGAIPVCSYPPMKLGDINTWAKRTAEAWDFVEAKAVITDDSLVGLVSHAYVAACVETELLSEKSFEQIIQNKVRPVHHDDIAFLQFSSGTTGKQKAVALKHEAVINNIKMILEKMPQQNQSCVSWLPLYHDMGLVGALLSSIYLARPIALIRPDHFLAKPKLWLEVLSKTKANISVAPNFAYGLCVKKANDIENLDLSNWKVALCGAETVHANTLDEFINKFKACGFKEEALTPVYGMAEIALAATFSSLESKPKSIKFDSELLLKGVAKETMGEGISLCSVGKALNGVKIEILKNNKKCKEGEVGDIFITSTSMMNGYYKDEVKTLEQLVNGRLNTGDCGFIYKDELYLFGRKKDIIIIKGRNIDPYFIESSVYELNEIRAGKSAACSFTDTNSAEEGFYFFAELKDNKQIENEAVIKAKIESEILKNVGVKPIEIILLPTGALPRTSSGKIQRVKTLELWLDGQLKGMKTHKDSLFDFCLLSLKGKFLYYKQRILGGI